MFINGGTYHSFIINLLDLLLVQNNILMEKTLLRIIQIFLGIIFLLFLAQLIFGASVSFLPGDVVARIIDTIGSFGSAGFVLIFIVLFFVIYLNNRVKKKKYS